MNQKEQLIALVYDYMELAECGEPEADSKLKEIYQFCIETPKHILTEGSCRCSSKCSSKKPTGKPPAPKPKSQFAPGDLVRMLDAIDTEAAKCVFISHLPIEDSTGYNYSSVFYLKEERLIRVFTDLIEPVKKKQTVLSAPEIVKMLEDDGYEYFTNSPGGLGWWNSKSEYHCFNVYMLKYCGKEPGGDWSWNPKWLK